MSEARGKAGQGEPPLEAKPQGEGSRASASDALNYADDFSTIFKAVNWTVIAAESAEKLPYSSSGLAIEVRDENLPPSAEALRDALRIYGIEAQVVSAPLNVREPINFVLAVTEP